jgi:hypothetical protein
MKKIFIGSSMLLTLAFTACQNENTVNPRPSDEIVSTVVVKGRVKAELNNTNAVVENAPAGLKIVAEISSRDLVLNPTSTNYPSKYYEGTVDNNGEYTITVEVGPNGSDVEVYFPDFRADVSTVTTPVSTVFSGSSSSIYVIKGQDAILDFNY